MTRSLRPDSPRELAERVDSCQVRQEHLGELRPIHELLKAINDPVQAAGRIAPLLDAIPVLVARCERRLLRKSPYAEWHSTDHLLSLIGNAGLESELLELLEDLTQLKYDMQSERPSG